MMMIINTSDDDNTISKHMSKSYVILLVYFRFCVALMASDNDDIISHHCLNLILFFTIIQIQCCIHRVRRVEEFAQPQSKLGRSTSKSGPEIQKSAA